MKRLLLPLLAALALPSNVFAHEYTHYLIIYIGGEQSAIPMKSMIACEKALKKSLNMDNYETGGKYSTPMGAYGICLEIE